MRCKFYHLNTFGWRRISIVFVTGKHLPHTHIHCWRAIEREKDNKMFSITLSGWQAFPSTNQWKTPLEGSTAVKSEKLIRSVDYTMFLSLINFHITGAVWWKWRHHHIATARTCSWRFGNEAGMKFLIYFSIQHVSELSKNKRNFNNILCLMEDSQSQKVSQQFSQC